MYKFCYDCRCRRQIKKLERKNYEKVSIKDALRIKEENERLVEQLE